MLLFRELRLIAIDFADDPGVQAGATVDEIVAAPIFLEKRGEAEITGVIQDTTPAPPVISGTQVRCWVDTRTGVDPARYIARGFVLLSNGEVAQADAPIVVE